jgi:L-cysteine:1D-myo-inositol 2-amino-2-deoxy-alpha-D-glucopyranoside ligase
MHTWPDTAVPDLPGQAPETKIWDTASRALAVAAPGPAARLYACGITPYDATHMGHAATYVAWDLLVRAWRDAGHEVTYVQNVTDVDDPLLERAERDGEDWRELAAREIALYRSDMTALRVLPPARLVGAVEAMPLIEEFNAVLVRHGALYDLEGDVYFARATDPDFGVVSGLPPDQMAELSAERGGDPGRPGKKDPLDPMVWLTARPGEPSWSSDFGPGRPGWHVECAAIATRYLGVSFDVQAGGSDLIYPHHEMSASHARVAHGPNTGGARLGTSVFARRYAHAGMVRLGGEKMSKSLGNLVFVSKLLEAGVDPMAIRLVILAHHYRSDWDWTDEGLAAAQARLARWRAAVALAGGSGGSGVAGGPVLDGVREHIADDLDAPGALAVVDAWAAAVIAAGAAEAGAAGLADTGESAAEPGLARPGLARPGSAGALVRDAVDALLGVAL